MLKVITGSALSLSFIFLVPQAVVQTKHSLECSGLLKQTEIRAELAANAIQDPVCELINGLHAANPVQKI